MFRIGRPNPANPHFNLNGCPGVRSHVAPLLSWREAGGNARGKILPGGPGVNDLSGSVEGELTVAYCLIVRGGDPVAESPGRFPRCFPGRQDR